MFMAGTILLLSIKHVTFEWILHAAFMADRTWRDKLEPVRMRVNIMTTLAFEYLNVTSPLLSLLSV